MLFVVGEDLLIGVASLGVDFPRLEFGAGLKTEGGTTNDSNAKRGKLPRFFSWVKPPKQLRKLL